MKNKMLFFAAIVFCFISISNAGAQKLRKPIRLKQTEGRPEQVKRVEPDRINLLRRQRADTVRLLFDQAHSARRATHSLTASNLYHPRRQRWPEHFQWSADGTKVTGLTATGRATFETLQMKFPLLPSPAPQCFTRQVCNASPVSQSPG